MDKNITFSIIMPVYNVEKYIDKAINSIINQIYTNWELIIVNDGSTDKSREICDKYSALDNRIQVYHYENSGVSKSRNRALCKATGKYIGFIDSDDWVEKNWLQEIKEFIENNREIDLIVYGWIEEYEQGSKVKKIINVDEQKYIYNNEEFKEYYINKYLQSEFPGFCHNKIYRREIIENKKFREDFSLLEDEIFNYDIYIESKKVALLSKEFYHYRRFNNVSLTSVSKYKYDPYIYKF